MFKQAKNAWHIISRWLVPTWVVASILGLIVAYASEPDGPSVLETQSDQIDRKCTQYRESESERTQNDTGSVDELYKWSCEPEQQTEYEQNYADNPPRSSTDADLLAQERVAYWTFWIGIFTGFGLVALVGTLFETQQILKTTKESSRRELRAYMGVSGADNATIRQTEDEDWRPSFGDTIGCRVHYQNFGQTPAYIKREGFCFDVLPANFSIEDTSKLKLSDVSIAALQGVPMSKTVGRDAPLTREEAEGVRSGDLSLVVRGRIEYFDAFGQPRHLDICLKRNYGEGMFADGYEAHHEGNDAT